MVKKANELFYMRQTWLIACGVLFFAALTACENNAINEKEISLVNNEQGTSSIDNSKNGRHGQKGSAGQDGQSGEDGQNSFWGRGGDGGNGGDVD